MIGLHKNGYGRILAECMFTSKILYCQWATLAKEDDIFVIKTTKPLPNLNNWSDEEHIKFIRERILDKSNEELARVSILACQTEMLVFIKSAAMHPSTSDCFAFYWDSIFCRENLRKNL